MYKTKKTISGLVILIFLMNGCSLVSLGLSSSVNNELDSREWTPVNSDKVKAYNE